MFIEYYMNYFQTMIILFKFYKNLYLRVFIWKQNLNMYKLMCTFYQPEYFYMCHTTHNEPHHVFFAVWIMPLTRIYICMSLYWHKVFICRNSCALFINKNIFICATQHIMNLNVFFAFWIMALTVIPTNSNAQKKSIKYIMILPY